MSKLLLKLLSLLKLAHAPVQLFSMSSLAPLATRHHGTVRSLAAVLPHAFGMQLLDHACDGIVLCARATPSVIDGVCACRRAIPPPIQTASASTAAVLAALYRHGFRHRLQCMPC